MASRTGNGDNPAVSLYPCSPGGPNDYIFIMAVTPKMWQMLCKAIERDDLASDPRFDHAALRIENADVLRQEITAWTTKLDKHEAMRILAAADVPASAVFDSVDLFKDEHLNQRGFIHEVSHDNRGQIRMLGWPARLSESKVEITAASPLGKHTQEVIASDLGLSAAEFDTLKREGAFG